MPNVTGAYCELADLRKGDIPLPAYMGDGTSYVKGAAEEIDAAIGHIYVTPLDVETSSTMTRPAILMVKKINWLLASGRLVLNLATSSENLELHAYGNSMLKEAQFYLNQIVSGELILTGAEVPTPDPDADKSFTGPAIFNEDSESLVQSFYDRQNPNLPIRFSAPAPYEGTRQ